MKQKRIIVKSSAGEYRVVCGTGALRGAGDEISRLGKFSRIHVISSPKVWRAVGKGILRSFSKNGQVQSHLMNDAEAAKNLTTAEKLSRSLVRAGNRPPLAPHRPSVAALSAMSLALWPPPASAGIALVQIPTTLIAQVDSAVGRKTGVHNLPEGKNLVGTFYPARPGHRRLRHYWKPLSPNANTARRPRQKVIKYGVIADAKLFSFLEKNFDAVLRRDPAALAYIIPRCLEIKAQVVSRDERESGLREILNFGHTFGHALETITNYRVYQHGEAVAWGMMAAALLGHEIGLTPADEGLPASFRSFAEWPRSRRGPMFRQKN